MFNFPFSIISTKKLKKLRDSASSANKKASEILFSLETQRGLAGALLKSMNEGVLAVNCNQEVILANSVIEKMFNVIEPEILGKKVREVIRNNDITELIERSLAKKKIVKQEINIIIPFEATFDADISPVFNSRSELLGVVCVLHDITDLRKLERHRSEFVANVSHELKTPLTAIRSFVETLILGAVDDSDKKIEFLKKIEKHSENLSELIDDILELSKLETKKELGPFTKIPIVDLLERAIDMINEKAKKKSITIEKHCPKENFLVLGIEDHLYRAFLNILDNAIKFTDKGGKIAISCKKLGGSVEITISDTGIGIPESHIPRLFERFYRVDIARSRDMGGTGLGLAIVKHVMNVHNGSVSVVSDLGKGSTFSLVLPLN